MFANGIVVSFREPQFRRLVRRWRNSRLAGPPIARFRRLLGYSFACQLMMSLLDRRWRSGEPVCRHALQPVSAGRFDCRQQRRVRKRYRLYARPTGLTTLTHIASDTLAHISGRTCSRTLSGANGLPVQINERVLLGLPTSVKLLTADRASIAVAQTEALPVRTRRGFRRRSPRR